MTADTITTDYLIIGAGTAGMAFADALLAETDATIAIVDRRHRPGGHWNDAYPFVRLHQPSGNYGVNSRPLGADAKDVAGFNAGLQELASGAEVVSYFDQVMRRHFLPSGRVQFFPMSAYADGAITSLLSGAKRTISARRIVDAAYLSPKIPAETAPAYAVAPGMLCAPPNDLPRLARADTDTIVIGAGKTGMDACIWLLENGADPDRIRWIMPRDAWMIDRENFQLDDAAFAQSAGGIANQVESAALATSLPDLFARLEACGQFLRLDPTITPTAYHCATVTKAELAALRHIRNVVRLGRVEAIEADRIVLANGAIPTTARTLHIDCTASALSRAPTRPVFEGDRITLQCVRQCQPAFSAAFIAHVEATRAGDAEKNTICRPIPLPDRDIDWLVMFAADLRNRVRWGQDADLGDWQAGSRLDGFTARARRLLAGDPAAQAHLQRYSTHFPGAMANLKALLADVA